MSEISPRSYDSLSNAGTCAQSFVMSVFGTDGEKTKDKITGWKQIPFLEWKTFCLRTVDHSGTYGAGTVEIHAAMELKAGDEANTESVILDTLNSANRTHTTEHPWRYVRCEITASFTKDIVVDMMGINK